MNQPNLAWDGLRTTDDVSPDDTARIGAINTSNCDQEEAALIAWFKSATQPEIIAVAGLISAALSTPGVPAHISIAFRFARLGSGRVFEKITQGGA